MFDLDKIEEDWKICCHKLSEEEIIEIYKSEGVTKSMYNDGLDEYYHKTHIHYGMTPEEKLLKSIFGEDKEFLEKIKKEEDEASEKYEYLTVKKHLSNESQKKVVEGCLDIVFDETRYWYDLFDKKISEEKLYYVCSEGLINAVKYCLHCEKPVFKQYVLKCIETNIIKNVSKWEHISYKDAKKNISNIASKKLKLEEENDKYIDIFNYDYEKEEVEKPSKIYYRLRNENYDENYIRNISSEEFMKDYYNNILSKLDNIEKMIMMMSFDTNGYKGLPQDIIGDYLGMNAKKVSNIKSRAIKKLKNDITLKKYL